MRGRHTETADRYGQVTAGGPLALQMTWQSGAGLLVGWPEPGIRPKFDLVTGISVGALIAPFAFLGSPYH
jgi:hypothetical protein